MLAQAQTVGNADQADDGAEWWGPLDTFLETDEGAEWLATMDEHFAARSFAAPDWLTPETDN